MIDMLLGNTTTTSIGACSLCSLLVSSIMELLHQRPEVKKQRQQSQQQQKPPFVTLQTISILILVVAVLFLDGIDCFYCSIITTKSNVHKLWVNNNRYHPIVSSSSTTKYNNHEQNTRLFYSNVRQQQQQQLQIQIQKKKKSIFVKVNNEIDPNMRDSSKYHPITFYRNQESSTKLYLSFVSEKSIAPSLLMEVSNTIKERKQDTNIVDETSKYHYHYEYQKNQNTHYHPNNNTETSIETKNKYQSTIDLDILRRDVDIIAVIESYSLQGFQRTSSTSGRAIAVCPFHDDHNPSLHIVNSGTNRNFYNCFACGAGGDVFKFVQEYSKLPQWDGQQKMTYGEAIQYVRRKFLNVDDLSSSISTEEQERIRFRKERILAANAAAATYYSDNIRQINAGGVRYYLRSRGLLTLAITVFRLGYAPDCFYSSHGPRRMDDPARIGSLVNHLKTLGFTPNEIIDAGLAIRTKQSNEVAISVPAVSSTKVTTTTTIGDTNQPIEHATKEDFDYDSLVDRFRNRLMVPILDRSGSKVLAFGGRTIPSLVDETDTSMENWNEIIETKSPSSTQHKRKESDFIAPKYLNSPESLVFEKKKILYGQHLAELALSEKTQSMERKDDNSQSYFSDQRSVIIVEGYMDAITLWAAGVRNVVASMGTAISPNQLSNAAKVVQLVSRGGNGGKIILCLDNDNAGMAAVERIANNGMLRDVAMQHIGVDVFVATLPFTIKDPADFFETRTNGSMDVEVLANAVSAFHEEVINKSIHWVEWYVTKTIKTYNPQSGSGTTGSLGQIFESIANFLATSCTNPADRIKYVTSTAGELALYIAMSVAGDANSVSQPVSDAVRVQLESELLDRTARIARNNESVLRRAESISNSKAETQSIMSGILNGQGQTSQFDADETAITTPIPNNVNNASSNMGLSLKDNGGSFMKKKRSTRAKITRPKESVQDSLTPHFAGFQFKNKSDRQWLGVENTNRRKNGNKVLVLGHNLGIGLYRDDDGPSNKLVYFNSADFNGHQFLTEDASLAGYSLRGNKIKPDSSVIKTGIASMIERDSENMRLDAENGLLRILIRSKASRTTLRNMVTANLLCSREVHDKSKIWSSNARQWLFERLLGFEGNIDLDSLPDNSQELRVFLSMLPDVPPEGFANISNPKEFVTVSAPGATQVPTRLTTSTAEVVEVTVHGTSGIDVIDGELDSFFYGDLTDFGSETESMPFTEYNRSTLRVQELYTYILSASKAMHLKRLRHEILVNSLPESLSDGKHFRSDLHELVLKDSIDNNKTDQGMSVATFDVSDSMPNEQIGKHDDRYQSQLYTDTTDRIKELSSANLKGIAHADSLQKMMNKLIDESVNDGRPEGRVSAKVQSDLSAKLDAFIAENDFMSSDVLATELNEYYSTNDEPYEAAWERFEEEWGDWFHDEYMWSPGDSANAGLSSRNDMITPHQPDDEDERETVEEALKRMGREWGE